MRASDFARVAEGQMRLVQCPQCGCWFLADAASEGEACRPCYEGWNPPPREVSHGSRGMRGVRR